LCKSCNTLGIIVQLRVSCEVVGWVSSEYCQLRLPAEYSGYSRAMIAYWIDKGILRYEEPPTTGERYRCIRIRKADLDALLDSFYRKSNTADQRPHGEPEGLILLPRASKLPMREGRAGGATR
jgi:hypothetical protein